MPSFLTLSEEDLDLCFAGCQYALSARRIWEHMHWAQINPFASITAGSTDRPQDYVDIIDVTPRQQLSGLTLGGIEDGRGGVFGQIVARNLARQLKTAQVRTWLAKLQGSLLAFSLQHELAATPGRLLDDVDSPLGIKGLHCGLQHWFESQRAQIASPIAWLHQIASHDADASLHDELRFSRLEENLSSVAELAITAQAAAEHLDYSAVRLSIVPVTGAAVHRLHFTRVTAGKPTKRIKPKLKSKLLTTPQWQDEDFGYRIDKVTLDDLFGQTSAWFVFTPKGEPVTDPECASGLCDSPAAAKRLANRHAQSAFPAPSTLEHWWARQDAGGKDYREWLVTLPHFASSYFTERFKHRNVLLHMSCDTRAGANGERVLVLQELHSDWTRDAIHAAPGDDGPGTPPWLHEWPALALKLLLLHAAHEGKDAFAWTSAVIQLERHAKRDEAGLRDLYDQSLPQTVNRLLRKYRRQCEPLDIYQPTEGRIAPTRSGNDVLTGTEMLPGSAPVREEAQPLQPDGTLEQVQSLHGVRLDKPLRQAILRDGFSAWGWGNEWRTE